MESAINHTVLRHRVETEYSEMPGLKLTVWQAGRLWNVSSDVCEAVLVSLVQTGFLHRTGDGQFLRPSST